MLWVKCHDNNVTIFTRPHTHASTNIHASTHTHVHTHMHTKFNLNVHMSLCKGRVVNLLSQ